MEELDDKRLQTRNDEWKGQISRQCKRILEVIGEEQATEGHSRVLFQANKFVIKLLKHIFRIFNIL